MRIVYKEERSDGSQGSVGSIEERFGGLVVLRSDPFALEDTPQGLGEVEVWRVRRKEEDEQPPFLPYWPQFLDLVTAMNRSVVKYDEGIPCPRLEGEPVEELSDLAGGDAFGGQKPVVVVFAVNHAEDVEAGYPLRGDVHILVGKLPSVRDVPFRADVALVGVVEVYAAFDSLLFKFLQLLDLVLVELRRGSSPWAFPYTLISCANADKKRLKVDSLASFPLDCCQVSRALFTPCRSCSMAWRTASSSVKSMMALRPRPGRGSSPLIPSSRYLFSQELTVSSFIPTLSPTLDEDFPSDFNSTAWQRILKQCLVSLRYPLSSSARSASLNAICVAFISDVFNFITKQTAE